MFKVFFTSLLSTFITLSAPAESKPFINNPFFNKILTCITPLVEGELHVYLSRDRTKAKVSLSDIFEYEALSFYVGGPVVNFDYETELGLERLIWAVDGGHELHLFDNQKDRFVKTAELTCERK